MQQSALHAVHVLDGRGDALSGRERALIVVLFRGFGVLIKPHDGCEPGSDSAEEEN